MTSSTESDFTKLFIHNIDFRATNEDIYRVFKAYGKITKVEVPRDKDGKHRGLGFVEFATHNSAVAALDDA
jgi:polyadenylate-binding protein